MPRCFILAVGLGVMLMGGVGATARAAETPKAATQEVRGTVKDALGRPIPAAAVTLQDAQGKTKAKTSSDAEGNFTLKGIAPGFYAVVGNKKDFKPATAIVSVTKTGAKPVQLALQAKELSVAWWPNASINRATRCHRKPAVAYIRSARRPSMNCLKAATHL